MDVEIPANTTGVVYIPTSSCKTDISENGKPLSEVKEIKITGSEGNYFVVQVGSGIYHFSSSYDR